MLNSISPWMGYQDLNISKNTELGISETPQFKISRVDLLVLARGKGAIAHAVAETVI